MIGLPALPFSQYPKAASKHESHFIRFYKTLKTYVDTCVGNIVSITVQIKSTLRIEQVIYTELIC